MNYRFFILFAVILFSFTAAAQDYPKVEFFGAYQFTHVQPNFNANGWDTSLALNLTSWFGAKADFSGAHKRGENLFTFMFGPVFTLRKSENLTPFAHILLGNDYLTDSRSSSGFSMALGGGLDVKVSQEFAVRLVQADWLPLDFKSNWEKKNVRVSTGLVWRF